MSVSHRTVPAANRLTTADAPRAERAAHYAQGVTSMDAAAVASCDKHRTPLDVWNAKTGNAPAESATDTQRRRVRVDYAPQVVKLFGTVTGLATRRTGLWASKAHPHMIAILDGLAADGGTIEATTTVSWTRDEWGIGTELTPRHIIARLAHDLAVTGRSHAYAVCLVLDTGELIIRKHSAEQLAAEIERAVRVAEEFWGRVTSGTRPPVEAPDAAAIVQANPVVARGMREMAKPLAAHGLRAVDTVERIRAQRELVDAEIKALKARKDELDAQLRAEIGDHQGITVQGAVVATWDHTGVFDDKAFQAAYPVLARQYTVPSTKLDWKTLIEEHPQFVVFRARKLDVKASPTKRTTTAHRDAVPSLTLVTDAA